MLCRFGVSLLLAVACKAPVDTWYAPGGSFNGPQLAGEHVVRVKDMPTAIERLKEVPWSRLNDDDLWRLTGEATRGGSRRPYLIRSVGYAPSGGGHNVWVDGTEVSVLNAINGRQERMYRQAVVVYLEFEPTKLYVDCVADL